MSTLKARQWARASTASGPVAVALGGVFDSIHTGTCTFQFSLDSKAQECHGFMTPAGNGRTGCLISNSRNSGASSPTSSTGGVVKKAAGPTDFLSPVLFVPKPRDPAELHLCVHFRRLNAVCR